MLNLIFLPLMRHSLPKRELAKKSIEMAQTIDDENKRDVCIASTVAFMQKYLNDNEMSNILEVLRMIGTWERILVNERIDERMEFSKKLLKKGMSVEDIVELTELDIEVIEGLQRECKENGE